MEQEGTCYEKLVFNVLSHIGNLILIVKSFAVIVIV